MYTGIRKINHFFLWIDQSISKEGNSDGSLNLLNNENKDGALLENTGTRNAGNVASSSSTNFSKVNQETGSTITNFQIFMDELLDNLKNVTKIRFTLLEFFYSESNIN